MGLFLRGIDARTCELHSIFCQFHVLLLDFESLVHFWRSFDFLLPLVDVWVVDDGGVGLFCRQVRQWSDAEQPQTTKIADVIRYETGKLAPGILSKE